MRRTVAIAVFGVALLAVLAVPAMGIAPSDDAAAQADDTETAPGEQLAGVVGVQGAELDGDLEQRAFGIQFAQAADNESQADVVADRFASVDERLDELQERKATLEERYETGEIRAGKYRAEMAKVATEIRMLSQAANQTEQAAGNVPADLLEERGVNTEAIQSLKEKASDLSGPEVAEIARGIAGPDVGESPGVAAGNATGPPVNTTGSPDADDDNPASDRPGDNPSAGPADDADGDNQSAGPDDNPGNESADRSDSTPDDDSAGGPDDQPGNDAGNSDDTEESTEDDDSDA